MDVEIRCPCPAKDGEPRHESDTVSLREKLDFHAATSIRKEIGIIKMNDPDVSTGEVLAMMTGQYLLFGIEAWTLVGADGKALDVTRSAIRELLERLDPDAAMTLTDAADELYAPIVLFPLVARVQESSPPTPTRRSTSARKGSGDRHPKPSRPSSITTFPTAGTGTTTKSRDGDSSSSRSLASAR